MDGEEPVELEEQEVMEGLLSDILILLLGQLLLLVIIV